MYHFCFQASIVGFKIGNVLHIGVRNRYCSICASCQNAKQTPPSHMCFLDWKKSATSIEADTIAGNYLALNTTNLSARYFLFVKWFTTPVHRKLLETMPYGLNLMVEKVECKNHVLRNYCHKLTDLTKNTKFPVTSRNLLKQQIPRFRTTVDKAI
ncbi:hypothetical protein PR048_008992 [Dryococelus australis]|uniref:Mutator-like transposase domain-containing protein n=1 Tax=Dryococelus australis TaxID=614101 RepID=A0ABQ9I0H5_9NEOP|nr:hypothetical protein PR048_008992 [Dryococelus australis]